uniref:Uncharacterized protein n=1 Tax=Globisporangium ultimum (strain ATCC 200006 / CBS 805.95 / DAOM BR144) TaxID=431595 RepID=K3WXS9_GLOUD
MDCLNDPICFQAVRDYFVPKMKDVRPTGDSTSAYYSESDWVTMRQTNFLELTSLIRTTAKESLLYTSVASWKLFTNAVKCFASRPCDLEYMTAAVEPPATAHIPTYMKYEPGGAQFALAVNTTLKVKFLNNEYSFVQDDDPQTFISWLTDLVGMWTTVVFRVAERRMMPDISEFYYFIKFQDSFGPMPQFSVPYTHASGSGSDMIYSGWQEMSTWWPRLWLETVNELPKLQKLMDYFALSPSSNATVPDTPESSTSPPPGNPTYQCASCEFALRECFSNGLCQNALVNYAIPAFREAGRNSEAVATLTGTRYQANYASQLQFDILPIAYLQPSQNALMQVLECSASSTCIEDSCSLVLPNNHANLILENAFVDFIVAPSTQMSIHFAGSTYSYEEGNDVALLKHFLDYTVMGAYRALAYVQRSVADDTGMVQYHIEFPYLYSQHPPMFSWQSDIEGGGIKSSTETMWRLVFVSTSADISSLLWWWLEWLGTNGSPNAALAPQATNAPVTTPDPTSTRL